MDKTKKVAKHMGHYITGFMVEPVFDMEPGMGTTIRIRYTHKPELAAEMPEEQLKFLKKALNIEIIEV